MLKRFLILSAAICTSALTACTPSETAAPQTPPPPSAPYSLIGKITVQDGMRTEFTELLSGVLTDSDCISCRLITDKSNANVLWVSETWPSEKSHDDALKTPKAMTALTLGRPMIVSMERMADTGP